MVLLAALSVAGPGTAQQRPSINALPQAPVSPRFSGLGGAAVAMIGHAGSVFTNPAGIAPVRNMSLEGAYARLTDSSSYFMGAAAVRLGPASLGGGVRYLRFDAGRAVHDNLESVASVITRVKGVALGLSANYFAVEDSAGAVTRTLTSDVAVTVYVFDIAALAYTAQNIGRAGFGGAVLPLPSTMSLGFSLNLIDTYSNGRLLATVERQWIEGDGRTLFGIEGGAVFYGVGVMARVGMGGRVDDSPFTRLGWGGTLVLGRAALDYAYLERRAEGPLHLLGLRLTP